MPTFVCHKIGRDKGPEGFKSQGITPKYTLLKGEELRIALKHKLIEESQEIQEAQGTQEIIGELADLLEVIDGLCKAYTISLEDIMHEKEKRFEERGGFETGFYLETIQMSEDNRRVEHFRKSPDKYPEI